MADKLNGRLEVVKIEEPLSAPDNCNYAELFPDKKKVTVRNALSYEGRSCLVRFDLQDGLHRPEPEGYFISSVVPLSFEGLAPEQYVLVGLWEEKSSKSIPTLQRAEQLYRPGNMPFFRYFQNGFSQKQGVHTIDKLKIVRELKASIPRFIRRIDPQRASRVFIIESEIDLERIIVAAKNQNLSPIMMEPLTPAHQKV